MPCGAAAAARCSPPRRSPPKPDTLEEDVKAALTKVSLGEVDAALVYTTDVRAAGDKVQGIPFPEAERGGQQVPDLRAVGGAEPGGRAGVRRPGPLRRRADGAEGRRLPDAVSRRRAEVSGCRCSSRRCSASPSWCCRWSGCSSARPGRGCGPQLTAPGRRAGAAAVADLRRPRPRPSPSCSACRWPGCSPGRRSAAGRCCARWSPCRSCCRRSSAASRCSSCSAGRACSAGRCIEATGWSLPFTTPAVVIAETFVAMPFLVVSVEGALRAADARFEDAAATLGAARWTTFRRVTLPLVAPGIGGRRGALLGPRAGRVRRDDHLRRQLPRDDADHAAGRLPGAAERPGGGDRALARAAGGLGGHAAAPPRPVAAAGRLRHEPVRGRRRPAGRAGGRRRPGGGRRRGARRPRAERRGQVQRAARAGRAAASPTAAGSSVGDEVWDDVAAGTHLPPHRRSLGVVFQDTLLFPHLSVADNVAFGLRTRGMRAGRGTAGGRPSGWTRVGLGGPGRPPARPSSPAVRPSGSRWPGRWSGEPRLLLLDEPLSALDARTRLTVRAELRRHLADFARQHGAGHPRPGRRDGAGRPGRRRRGGAGRAGGHPGRGQPGARAPTTWPGWSGCRCSPGHGRGPVGAAGRRRERWRSRRRPRGPVFAAVRPGVGGALPVTARGQPAQRLAGAAGRGRHRTGPRCAASWPARCRWSPTSPRRAFAELGLRPGIGGVGDGEGLRGRRLRPLRMTGH